MPGLNGSQGPSHAPLPPDFNAEFRKAQQSGDFEFVLETAKGSHKMLVDFRDSVKRAKFPGNEAKTVAMALNFLDTMIVQAAGQLNALRQAAHEAQAAIKNAKKESDMGPETPDEEGKKEAPDIPPPTPETAGE